MPSYRLDQTIIELTLNGNKLNRSGHIQTFPSDKEAAVAYGRAIEELLGNGAVFVKAGSYAKTTENTPFPGTDLVGIDSWQYQLRENFEALEPKTSIDLRDARALIEDMIGSCLDKSEVASLIQWLSHEYQPVKTDCLHYATPWSEGLGINAWKDSIDSWLHDQHDQGQEFADAEDGWKTLVDELQSEQIDFTAFPADEQNVIKVFFKKVFQSIGFD